MQVSKQQPPTDVFRLRWRYVLLQEYFFPKTKDGEPGAAAGASRKQPKDDLWLKSMLTRSLKRGTKPDAPRAPAAGAHDTSWPAHLHRAEAQCVLYRIERCHE